MEIYIQLGAGAGDKDIATNYKDGFTGFVKNKKLNINDKIILVEANPFNINKLEECWFKFENKKILNIAIVNEKFYSREAYIYYCKDDAPTFQVSSLIYNHVKKHYPKSNILKKKIKVKRINEFLYENCKNYKIKYLAIDIEGLDYDVIMSIDFNQFNIENLSFEILHLSLFKKINLINRLILNGYKYSGKGFDINGYDLMFQKKKGFLARINTEIFKFKFYIKYARKSIKNKIKNIF
jgi:FkbM family methyltransferase